VEANKLLYGLFIGSKTTFGSVFDFEGEQQSSSHFTRTQLGPGILNVGTIFKCGTPFFFRFSENKDYEVSFRLDRDNCSVVIDQLPGNNDGPIPLEVAKFDNRVSESNNGCLAAFRREHLY
jgi:hypothetical protein